MSTTPGHASWHKTAAVPDVRADFDRDLSPQGSSIQLRDAANVPVAGTVKLDGPDSPTLGKRTIRFVPSAPLAEGLYVATVTASAPGGSSTHSWRFTIDNSAPGAPTIASPADGDLVFDQPVLLRGAGEPDTRLIVLEDGETIVEDWVPPNGQFSAQLPYPPEDGVTHTISVRMRDRAGNIGPAAGPISFRHDSITVVPEITVPTEGAFLSSGSVPVAGYAKPGSQVKVVEGSDVRATALVDPSGRWSTTASFGEGVHTISAWSYDGAVTDGPSKSRSFTVDLTLPPDPAIATPSSGQMIAVDVVTISGTAEPNAKIEVREGTLPRATTQADPAGDWTTSARFADGSRTIAVRAFDKAGNGSGSTFRTFHVDTSPPSRPVIDSPNDGSILSTNAVPVVGRAEPDVTVTILRGAVTVGSATADGVGNWAATLTFGEGAHTITAVAQDAAGNRSEPSISRTFAVDTLAPNAPSIAQPSAGQTLSSTSVTISGTAEQASLVVVKEGATTIGSTATAANGVWSLIVTLAPGAHTIAATAQDPAGNLGPSSAPRNFSIVVPAPDTTPPPAPQINAPLHGAVTPASVPFSGSAEPNAQVRVVADSYLLATTTAAPNGSWSVTAVMEDGAHDIYARARDAAGNSSPASPTITITVDGTRPAVEIATPTDSIFLPTASATITGTATDNHKVARVELEYSNALGQRVLVQTADVCTGCPGPDITWQATPTLTPNVYRVQAYAVDQAGNRSSSAQIRIVRL